MPSYSGANTLRQIHLGVVVNYARFTLSAATCMLHCFDAQFDYFGADALMSHLQYSNSVIQVGYNICISNARNMDVHMHDINLLLLPLGEVWK
jgi:hypothetical protein